MKEFNAQTGGRYTYVDDFLNLQELALAFGQLFHDCDNFILSGCQVSGNAISAGFVYLNGKVRYFPGESAITKWPRYIIENNSTENIGYASGTSKVGRTIYGCISGDSIPTKKDPVTNKIPEAIVMNESVGGRTMQDAFIGKYALLVNAANRLQTINGNVKFTGDITASGNVIATTAQKVVTGNTSYMVSAIGSAIAIDTKSNSNVRYRILIEDGVGFRFYIGNTLCFTIGENGFVSNKVGSTSKGEFGSTCMSLDQLYNNTAAADNGAVEINMIGYSGGKAYYRNTVIGNGKGKALVSVNGSLGTITLSGSTTIDAGAGVVYGLVMKGSLLKDNTALTNAIAWSDSSNGIMATVGFSSSTNQFFTISCLNSDVEITGKSAVNIGPAIKENGSLLSEKYVQKTAYTTAMNKKADSTNVYSKTDADKTFAQLSSGLSQFVIGTNSQAVLRSQIGAIGSNDLDGFTKNNQFLADMAKTDADKAKIRANIGAATAGDFQPKLKDSGWLQCTGSGATSLYARQIGNIVCIQGKIKTTHSGIVFSVPNKIDAPFKEVYFCYSHCNTHNWRGAIAANSHDFRVTYCNGSCGQTTEFSITYMV